MKEFPIRNEKAITLSFIEQEKNLQSYLYAVEMALKPRLWFHFHKSDSA